MIAIRSDLNGFTVDVLMVSLQRNPRCIRNGSTCEAAPTFAQEHNAMVHELILAVVFLAMIAVPAIITTSPDRDERDSL
jgi:hypothetical protein